MLDYIYFDNAATTYPKPSRVIDAFLSACENCGGNAGRSGHFLSLEASRIIFETRNKLCEFFDIKKEENVIFTYNATYALNMAINGLIKRRSHVIISNLEHNSVFRPIHSLAKKNLISYAVFDALGSDADIIKDIKSKINPLTRAIICTHSSNVCPKMLPIKEIGEICKKHNLHFILDASQSAGHCKISLDENNVSLLCAPSHKGLYGVQGAGFLIAKSDFDFNLLDHYILGGNGLNSGSASMGNIAPEAFEAGTLPAPVIASLGAGVDFINEIGIDEIIGREKEIYSYMKSELMNMEKVKIYLPYLESGSIISFNIDGISSFELAELLNEEKICARAGYHCAALAHRALKTEEDGAVRLSFGYANTLNEAKKTIDVINKAANKIN